MPPAVGRSLETGTILAGLVLVLAATGILLSPTASDALPPLVPIQASLNFPLYVTHMAAAALLVTFTVWHLVPVGHAFSRKPGVPRVILVASHTLLALVVVEIVTGIELYFRQYAPLGKREAVLVHLAVAFVVLVPLAIHAWRGLDVWRARRLARTSALAAADDAGAGASAREALERAGRRRFVRIAAYSIAGLALAVAFARATAGQISSWRLNFVGATPDLPRESYTLRITGLVAKPVELTYAQIRALPARTVRFTHRCVEGWTYTDTFTGVPLPDVLALAGGLRGGAKQLILKSPEVSRQFHSRGSKYTVNLPIRDASNDEIYLVYGVGGEDLPVEHGAPVRIMSPVKWGYKACKWMTEIEVSADDAYLGYWEKLGYHKEGDYPGPIFA